MMTYLYLLISIFLGLNNVLNCEAAQNLSNITWGHNVDSMAELKSVLKSQKDMMDVDISLGKLVTDLFGSNIPILAHPPPVTFPFQVLTSDISLSMFLDEMKNYNNNNTKKIGIKLDFKSIEAFEAAVGDSKINSTLQNLNFPLWLNADILNGPDTLIGQGDPLDPTRFIPGAQKFPNATISLGWTTGLYLRSRKYSTEDINQMLQYIDDYNVTQNITFAVRAGLLLNSVDGIKRLLKGCDARHRACTLTVWSPEVEINLLDLGRLKEVIIMFGYDRVYVDLPIDI